MNEWHQGTMTVRGVTRVTVGPCGCTRDLSGHQRTLTIETKAGVQLQLQLAGAHLAATPAFHEDEP